MWRKGLVSVIATVLASGSALAQTGTITGRVTSAEGAAPVPGVHVVVSRTGIGADTRDDGRFTVAAQPGTYTVRATRIGFMPDSATVSVPAGGSVTVDFNLKPAASMLTDVVVVGYGEAKSRDLTGSVATVTSKDFNTGRIVSPEQLIQAKVPGVQVVGANEPGGGVSIRVRGGSSVTSSNEPLFVVDGQPLQIGGGVSAGRDPLNFLNPNDIETITVLKDASATSIWGSRGANGVIIITTKNGRQGTRLTYNGSVSRSSAVGGPQLLDAAQFQTAVATYAPANVAIIGTSNTNWLDAVERSATGSEHSLAVAGNKEDMNYRLSLGYLNQGGVLQGSLVKRVSTAATYNDQLFDHRLDIQANLRGGRTDDAFTPNNVLGNAVSFAPTLAPRTSTGAFTQYASNLAPGNPLSTLSLVTDKGTTYRNLGNMQATYRMPFMEALSATTNVGYDYSKAERTTFQPSTERGQGGVGGTFYRNSPSQLGTVFDAYATFAPAIDRYLSHFDLTAGYSYERARGDYPSFTAQGLSSNLLGTNGLPSATTQINVLTQDESRLASFFGRANASIKDRYLLALSVRRDGSSRFGASNQWGVFPAIGLGWRVVDESFMRRFGAISDLKLRASYGVNGNQAFANYQQYSSYTYGGTQVQAQFGNQFITTIRPSAADPNIKWEQTTSNDVGLDYGLFNNRIAGTFDYYFKKTKDLIFTVPIAAGTNLSNVLTTNIGSLQNRGFELGLNALVFDGSRGFTWDANFTASTNKNKLLRINAVGTGNEQILTGGIAGGVGSNIEVLQPGFPINSFLVFRHRTDPATGQPVVGDLTDIQLYQDINGDGIITQTGDLVPYKNPAPKWIFGHTSTMGFRNFDMSFTLRANRGNYVYNNVASNLGHYSNIQGPGPINLHASVLKYGFVRPQYWNDLYVENASFIKMDNLSLGYTFHGLSSARQVRILGTIQNVFTITDYTGVDPEAGINGIDNTIYPRSRTFTFGTNIAF